MIKLEVENYCHDCPEFDADIEYRTDVLFDSLTRIPTTQDTTIRCKHQAVCKNLIEYFRGRLAKFSNLEGTLCACYDGESGLCLGTKNREVCACEGDLNKCDFK